MDDARGIEDNALLFFTSLQFFKFTVIFIFIKVFDKKSSYFRDCEEVKRL